MMLSRKRTAMAAARERSAQSNPSSCISSETLTLESRHTEYGPSGCSAQGFWQLICSKYQELLHSLIRSMKTTPGSPDDHALEMICCQSSRALIVRTISPCHWRGH